MLPARVPVNYTKRIITFVMLSETKHLKVCDNEILRFAQDDDVNLFYAFTIASLFFVCELIQNLTKVYILQKTSNYFARIDFIYIEYL